VLTGLILFFKGDLVGKYVSRMVLKAVFLVACEKSGANSITALFDTVQTCE